MASNSALLTDAKLLPILLTLRANSSEVCNGKGWGTQDRAIYATHD